MKTLYIKVISILFFTLIATRIFAAPSEAEYKKLNETWKLQADGSQEYRCYQELTLFTHTAMNNTYGETFIIYNPKFQELKIHASYTRQKDGSIVHTPANAFVEVLPRNAAGAPEYNHLKEMVIVHTGLELGATIVLDYSILSLPGYLPELDICKPLQKSSPIKEYTLTFTAPVEKEMYYETISSSIKPIKTSQSNNTQLKWTFRNLPAFSQAPEVSMRNGDVPGILLTTYPSSREALQVIHKQFNSHPGAEITTLAQQLTQKSKTETEKLRAIQAYIIGNLDFCPLTLSQTGYRLRPASRTITTAYGTEIEKINLLVALLNAAGIKAIPAAAYDINVSPQHCGLTAISKLVVLAKADGKQYWLNPYDATVSAKGSNFLLNLTNAEPIPSPSSTNHIRYKATITWTEQKANANIEASFSNSYIPYTSEYANQLLSVNPDYKTNSSEEVTTITGRHAVRLNKNQNYTFLTLPETHQGIAQTHRYARYNSKRSNNLLLPALIEEEYTYTITLPDYLLLCTPVKEEKIENAVGSLLTSIQQNGQNIFIHRSLKLNKKLISPSQYPAFRQLMIEWEDQNERQLLLKDKK